MELQNSKTRKGTTPTSQNNKNNKDTYEDSTFSASSAASHMKHKANKATMAQYNADAKLMAEFEKSTVSGKSFDYSKSVPYAPEDANEEEIIAYLSRIQRGGLVQPFGCMVAIEEPSFKIIGYSENCFDMLGLKIVEPAKLKGLIGVDARTLFTPSSGDSLAKVMASRELSLLNPIWVHSRSNHKPFYAILHRIDVGIVIDLEPANSSDPALLLAGAVQSQKLAVRSITRLQSLPGGDVGILCDTAVEDVQKLTGYDRVMVYKFHDDNHGEIVSEIRRSDLEPYLGLHYPAADVPQAARFLFKQNRVRMICDCNAQPVKIVQSEELKQPICLVNSTLRSPHECHSKYMGNMGSIASLVMAVLINTGDSMKLWGLLVCHHTSPRYVPFPLRYACEFFTQAFSLQLNMELQLASQLAEKKTLQMQTLLCDMLLRDVPFGIVTQSPTIKDLVKCDGAALYCGGKCWLLGVTPTEEQVKDIANWLLVAHKDSTGLSTDCLVEAGYPGAAFLGDAVCGMATARVASNDFLFWFRSHTAKEVKWGGAKHHPDDEDDGGKMHPRSSFNAFLEVVKSRSLPWEVPEINAIHSLQIIMRESIQEIENSSLKTTTSSQQNGADGPSMDELSSVAMEMVRLIETATAPIFGVDPSGLINGWNEKIADLTGLHASEAVGKSLLNDIVHEDSHATVEKFLHRALLGEEDKNVEIKLRSFGKDPPESVIYLVTNTCTSRDHKNDVVGVCFVAQDITPEKAVMDKFIQLRGDYEAIVQSLNPLIPPIFASDENACCSEWNAAMERLTGWTRYEVMGRTLPGEIFGGLCHLRGQDTLTKFMILFYQAIGGHDTKKLPFSFFNRTGELVEVILTANKRTGEHGNVTGCFCFLQPTMVDPETSDERQDDKEPLSKFKEYAYVRQQMKNPLSGIQFTHKLLEATCISDNQKQLLETSEACEKQILSVIDNMDFRAIDDGKVELNMKEFVLGNVVDAIVSQVMVFLKEKNLQLLRDIPDQIKILPLYGDQIKLQRVLSDFLLTVVHHAPSPDGWVEIKVLPGLRLVQDGKELIHMQFRMTHPGQGVPAALIDAMSGGRNRWTTEEGIALNVSQKLLNIMNGNVHYVREENKCYFLIDVELKTSKSTQVPSSEGTQETEI
ncbi:Phytochrome E [Capsicum baccatum]|uniref:Phytochrome n=1 Tax=Capsicum baccatum TaxID=33114 RepID=A0A2G2XE21_CAPBA|nr:Phytochrome E [Capsicum baccatum]